MADENPPTETPPPPPANPPTDAPPHVPPPVPPAPETGASPEVLTAIKDLTSVVAGLVNKVSGVAPDVTPAKRPWTQWGSK